MQINLIKGRIVTLYGNQRNFAKAIGVSYQTVSNKLRGFNAMTLKDVEKWSKALQLEKSEIPKYFF